MADGGSETDIREILDDANFTFEGKDYKIIQNSKPSKETKTDFYILAKSLNDNTTREFKISYKKNTFSFVENKVKTHRIPHIYGKNWSEILKNQTKPLKDSFNQEVLVNFVNETRQEIINILNNKSKRKIIIIGPCSIHDYKSCMEFGRKLKILIDKYSDKLLIIMRTYFEKPRTTRGWKGLINNPDLDNKYDINKGLKLARKILLDLNNIGVPCSYECLETITPNYISELISKFYV